MQTIRSSHSPWLLLVIFVTVTGCHLESVREHVTQQQDAPWTTPHELFAVALQHAGQGDLLRAEQYLIAAKTQGLEDVALAYWLVRVCVAGGRYHTALRHALDSLRWHPTNWRLRLVIASIHEALGDLESARLELETIVRAEPLAALPHYRLAKVYRGNARFVEDAKHHYRRYLELDPSGPHASETRAELAADDRPWQRKGGVHSPEGSLR